jgi:hypothetical protein
MQLSGRALLNMCEAGIQFPALQKKKKKERMNE